MRIAGGFGWGIALLALTGPANAIEISVAGFVERGGRRSSAALQSPGAAGPNAATANSQGATVSRGATVRLSVPIERWLFGNSSGGSRIATLPAPNLALASLRLQRREGLFNQLVQSAADPASLTSGGDRPGGEAGAATGSPSTAPAEGARRPTPKAAHGGGQPRKIAAARDLLSFSADSALVKRLLQSALSAQRRSAARLASLSSRSRYSAWLPELRLKAGHNTDQTLRLTPTDADPDRYQLTGEADLRFEATATWRLHRVVFASEELAVERLQDQQLQRKKAVITELLELLFDWQLAVLRARAALAHPDEQLESELRATQLRLALDVLTEGAFSRELSAAAPIETAPLVPAAKPVR